MLFPLPNILPGFLGWVNYFYLFILLCYVAWTKVCTVKTTVFPVVMYRCESWTIKKAERQRIDAFELLCWRRLLRVPWTARRSNQFTLKEISSEYPLEGLTLKLQFQYFGHLMQRTYLKRPWCWARLKAGREGDNRGWDGWIWKNLSLPGKVIEYNNCFATVET